MRDGHDMDGLVVDDSSITTMKPRTYFLPRDCPDAARPVVGYASFNLLGPRVLGVFIDRGLKALKEESCQRSAILG